MAITFHDYSYCAIYEQDFTDKELAGASFVHADAHGSIFNGATLRDADFTWADLHGAYFIGADIRDATFFGATLHHATFRNCTWRGTELDEAHLDDSTTLLDNRVVTIEEEQLALAQAITERRQALQPIVTLKKADPQPVMVHTEHTGLVQRVMTFLKSCILRRD